MALLGLLSSDALLNLLPEPVRSFLPRPRRVQECAGGIRVELRNIGGSGTERRARALEERLLAAGVTRAEVNGALGSVFIGCDAGSDDIDKLVAIAADLDEGDGPPVASRAADGVEQ